VLINLTPREILYLTDKIENDDCGWEDQEVDTFELLRKMADRWLAVVRPLLANQMDQAELSSKLLAVDLTEAELWLIRTKVSSLDGTPEDPKFGIRLLEKIFSGLLNPETEKGWLARQMGQPTGDGELEKVDVLKLMAEWKEQEDAAQGRTEDANEDPDQDAGAGARTVQAPSAGSGAESEA